MAKLSKKNKNFLIFVVLSFLLFTNIVKPFAYQKPSYNDFADTKTIEHIPNFLNVISNVFYLIVAYKGLIFLLNKEKSSKSFKFKWEKQFYIVIFVGVLLTAFGSSYYHMKPNDYRLMWDRLPMTIVFMGYFSAIVSERIDNKFGYYILYPLALMGIISVLYWHHTELNTLGGNLDLYVDVQFYPLLLIPFILYNYKSTYTKADSTAKVLILYLISKLFELFDAQIFNLFGFISGHTLKHIVSAYAILIIVKSLETRKLNN